MGYIWNLDELDNLTSCDEVSGTMVRIKGTTSK